MAVVTGSWLLDILILVATLLYLLHWYISTSYSYFKDRGIPYLKPLPFIGYIGLLTKSQKDMADSLYSCFPDNKFFGYFQSSVPTLLVKDPDMIQQILIKDFSHFHDRGFPASDHDPLSQNLSNLTGHSWRIMRQKLIPTFTTGKLKLMFDQIVKCGDNLMNDVEKVSLSREAVDARSFISNFTSEVIGSTAFGLDFSKTNPQVAVFNKKVSNLFQTSPLQMIRFVFIMSAPKIVKFFKIKMFPSETNKYFVNLVKATKEYRIQKNEKRNDYFQLLLSLQQAEESGKNMAPPVTDNSEEDALINQMQYVPQSAKASMETKMFTDEGLAAQSFVFLTGGTETVTSTLTFTLYNIAKNPHVQDKLKEEVSMALAKHGCWTYQAVKDMTYLDQIIQETQRLYPVIALLTRECTMPYTLPNSEAVIDKGTMVNIPVTSIQRDPKYYPSPEVFNPDRFSNNNHKPNSMFLPFGDGPRICIAMRFAILEVKVCLAKIFAQYTVEINSKTKEPFLFDKKSFFPKPMGGIWVDFKKDLQKVA